MIRALILCGVVAGVGFGAVEPKCFKSLYDSPADYCQVLDGKHVSKWCPCIKPQVIATMDDIKALEKRVEALEKGGVLVESFPTINPHPFGSEPDSQGGK